MDNNLLITGAGVDRTSGIDFPLATTLLPEIAAYAKEEGAVVHKTLRELLPGIRFTFTKMVSRAVDAITTSGADCQRGMVKKVEEAIENLPDEKEDVRKHG